MTILEHGMIDSGERIVAAVSGGPDSVCLLRILFELRDELKISLVVAHLDHGLRPREDEKETQFVSNLASRLNLDLAYEKASNVTKAPGTSVEEKARGVRYEFFEKVLAEHNAQKVALGHNMNDQAETVLMHLLRGSGPTGLSGIPPVRGNRFVRPLIQVTRDEIHAYLKQQDIPFMVDSSNLEKRYLRNKMRLELIPALLGYQPRLVQHLGELASLCREENQFMEEEARKGFERVTLDSSKNAIDLSIASLQDLPFPLQYRIIRQAIKQIRGNLRRIDIRHIKAIMDLANNVKPQVKTNLPEKLIVAKTYERLRFSLGSEVETVDYAYYIEQMGKFRLHEINQTILLDEQSTKSFLGYSPSPQEAFIDLDKIEWPLLARNFRAGDKFMPLGLDGFKKVKDVFIDSKIPSHQRKKVPVLKSRDDIVWVCGIQIDQRYRVTQDTKRILRCRVE
ncbi:MAG: tRNA lysidine(34) synthetase TilS [Deltaproteobacteria bacterium]|nr:tRNA lysidine(34) synthetase TilS [Deltaproteobacteria bacterium]